MISGTRDTALTVKLLSLKIDDYLIHWNYIVNKSVCADVPSPFTAIFIFQFLTNLKTM